METPLTILTAVFAASLLIVAGIDKVVGGRLTKTMHEANKKD
jgi:hypothetical protein